MQLTRDQILGAPKRTVRKVETPEWGEGSFVFVRSMTSRERDAFEYASLDEDRKPVLANYRARLAAATVCDEAGLELVFVEADAQALGDAQGGALDRICDVARELSGMNRRDQEAERKNS
jgi:hypothetical protein